MAGGIAEPVHCVFGLVRCPARQGGCWYQQMTAQGGCVGMMVHDRPVK